MIDTCHYAIVQTHRNGHHPANPNVHHDLGWVWRVNVGSSIATDVPAAGCSSSGRLFVSGSRGAWGISVPSSEFCWEPETAVKEELESRWRRRRDRTRKKEAPETVNITDQNTTLWGQPRPKCAVSEAAGEWMNLNHWRCFCVGVNLLYLGIEKLKSYHFAYYGNFIMSYLEMLQDARKTCHCHCFPGSILIKCEDPGAFVLMCHT